jgi:hypothetical protein
VNIERPPADVFIPPPLPPKGSDERRRLVQALARWVLAGELGEQAKESEAA